MAALELYNLRKFCRKHGIDIQEVDNALSYDENKQYLHETFRIKEKAKVVEVEDPERQFISEHPLKYYAACQMFGETTSRETGKLDTTPPRFSLKTKAHVGFSLFSLVKQKPQKSLV